MLLNCGNFWLLRTVQKIITPVKVRYCLYYLAFNINVLIFIVLDLYIDHAGPCSIYSGFMALDAFDFKFNPLYIGL